MLTFLRRIFWQPPELDEKVVEAAAEFQERSKDLSELRAALKDIRDTSEKKKEVLRAVASVHPISIHPCMNEVSVDERDTQEEEEPIRQSVG